VLRLLNPRQPLFEDRLTFRDDSPVAQRTPFDGAAIFEGPDVAARFAGPVDVFASASLTVPDLVCVANASQLPKNRLSKNVGIRDESLLFSVAFPLRFRPRFDE